MLPIPIADVRLDVVDVSDVVGWSNFTLGMLLCWFDGSLVLSRFVDAEQRAFDGEFGDFAGEFIDGEFREFTRELEAFDGEHRGDETNLDEAVEPRTGDEISLDLVLLYFINMNE